jgi:enoyl-CoA hydratase/carnithine racemase
MAYETLIVDQSGPIATITLNRPEARNALDFAMRRELLTALDEIEANPAARVVILTGAGGHFCAGGDVGTCASGARPPTARSAWGS